MREYPEDICKGEIADTVLKGQHISEAMHPSLSFLFSCFILSMLRAHDHRFLTLFMQFCNTVRSAKNKRLTANVIV